MKISEMWLRHDLVPATDKDLTSKELRRGEDEKVFRGGKVYRILDWLDLMWIDCEVFSNYQLNFSRKQSQQNWDETSWTKIRLKVDQN